MCVQEVVVELCWRAERAELAMIEMEERLDNCERDGVEQRDRAEQQLIRDHREVHTRDHCYFSRSTHTLIGRSRRSCGGRRQRGMRAAFPAAVQGQSPRCNGNV